MVYRTPAPLRAVGVLVRALLGLVVLVALLAGTPYVLLLVGTQPTELSGGMDVLLRPDDGTLFFTAITCIGWAAWAAFTWTVILEIIAVARRRSAPRLRGLGGMQSLASFLVGGIVLLAPTAASAATSAPAAAITAPQTDTSTPSASPTPSSLADNANSPTHTVTSAMELPWDLAEEYLGNGQRWQDIAALNPDIPGLASGDQYLPKGAVIKLPADAHSPTPAPASEEEPAPTVTVQSGDYLSKIAQEELGDGNEWPRLFEASRGKPQPDGLPAITDPNQIYAGQHVTVPGAQPEQHEPSQQDERGDESGREHTPPVTEAPDSEREPGNTEGDVPAPAPENSAPSEPTSRPTQHPGQEQGVPSATSRPSASPSPASPSASNAPSASGTPSPSAPSKAPASPASDSPLQLRTVLGAGALLAASITGALAMRRLLQRRRRKPGETIAMASETSSAEAQLASTAEPAGAARLDVALRTLAHHAEDGANLPALRAARIGARSLEILPEDLTQEPPAPFAPGHGGWWVLPGDAQLLDEEAAREVPAPYPGLVTLGSTKAGDLLLVNLAQLPALLLDGDPTRITEVCTSLAVEMGMSPWGSVVEVVTIGFGEDLPQLLPTSRIMHMRQAEHALRDLSERLLEAHQMPDTSHHPYLLLCAAALDGDTAWQFADVIDKASIPVTLVAPTGAAAAHFPDAEILNVDFDEPQQLDYTGTEITVQRLEHAAYQQIATALAVSGQPAEPAQGPWKEVPDDPAPAMPSQPAMAQPADHNTGAGTDISSDASATTPVTADATASEVFPALLAASADPTGLRLLPTAPRLRQDEPDDAPGAHPAQAETPETADVTLPDPENGAGADQGHAHDLHAPEIRVLGPVEVDGVATTGHGPRIAQLAALLYFRPGRSADALCTDMDPITPWGASTLNARLRGLRSALGNDPAGNAYVPRRRTGDDPYRLSPAVRCDWTKFLQLAERALPQGPSGLPDLEKALGLVRGRPFGSRPLPWAEPLQQEMITRIIDVAHAVATHRTPAGPHHDLTAARQAVATGLDVDDTSELLYRDWLRIEHAAGNRQGLHTAITRVQQVNRMLDAALEIETQQLIHDLLTGHDGRRAEGM